MKRIGILFMALFLTMAPLGCNGGLFGTSGTSMVIPEVVVGTYEGVAISLNSLKGYIKGQELSKQLVGVELDKKIAEWESARQLFIAAGDALKASIGATTPAIQAEKMKAYNDLILKASIEVGKLNNWKGGK